MDMASLRGVHDLNVTTGLQRQHRHHHFATDRIPRFDGSRLI